MRTMAKCAIAPSYSAPRISASQRAEASLSCAGTIVWFTSNAIAHLLHPPDSCGYSQSSLRATIGSEAIQGYGSVLAWIASAFGLAMTMVKPPRHEDTKNIKITMRD